MRYFDAAWPTSVFGKLSLDAMLVELKCYPSIEHEDAFALSTKVELTAAV
jgi:hypothetical protein